MAKNLKIKKWLSKTNRGMTYVELIVVLTIFSVMSTISILNYNKFESKINLKKDANSVAQQIVEAQKSALAGSIPPLDKYQNAIPDWKPAYGVSFETGVSDFSYFTDLDNNKIYSSPDDPLSPNPYELIDTWNISSGSKIQALKVDGQEVNNLSITFTRPYSRAIFAVDSNIEDVGNAEITIQSSDNPELKTYITISSSGRVSIK